MHLIFFSNIFKNQKIPKEKSESTFYLKVSNNSTIKAILDIGITRAWLLSNVFLTECLFFIFFFFFMCVEMNSAIKGIRNLNIDKTTQEVKPAVRTLKENADFFFE